MTMKTESEATVREAVGVFHDAAALEQAIDELLSSGFDRAELSMLAGETTVKEKLGHAYERVAELEDDPDAPRAAYIGRNSIGDARGALVGALMYVPAVAAAGAIVATGGALATAIAGAALLGGSGGMIGIYLSRLFEKHHADYLQRQLDHGGILLWVNAATREKEKKAKAILEKHAAGDVHVHDIPALEPGVED